MQQRSLDSLAAIPAAERLWPAPHEIHLWYAFDEPLWETALLGRCEALLTDDERDRHRRFVFAKDRNQYVIARALVRTTLSRYAPVAPEAWRFSRNRWGKPAIEPVATLRAAGAAGPSRPWDEPWARLSFNLSHARGLVALAVAADLGELGVDVEDTTRHGATVDIADRFFSATEAAALRALPATEQTGRFFTYWTLKESYIKARGMGLAIPLDQFSFHLDDEVRISFGEAIQDTPGAWQFELVAASARHLMAVGLRKRGDARHTLAAAAWAPPA